MKRGKNTAMRFNTSPPFHLIIAREIQVKNTTRFDLELNRAKARRRQRIFQRDSAPKWRFPPLPLAEEEPESGVELKETRRGFSKRRIEPAVRILYVASFRERRGISLSRCHVLQSPTLGREAEANILY